MEDCDNEIAIKRQKVENNIETVEEIQNSLLPDDFFWSIEDDFTFFPFGILSHWGIGNKRSAIVVWSEDYMINFIFKRITKAKQTKITKVRISLPKNETIKNISITQYNTLVLMNSGNVYCFKSMETMHRIEWLKGVRCLSIGSQSFSLIRFLESEKSLRLEIYEDSTNLYESPNGVKRSFDITFDERNIFDCQWSNESYTLLSILVDEENKEFLKAIIGNQAIHHEVEEIYFFTVSGNVFALIPGSNDDYSVEMLCSYASNVESIKMDQKQKICLIILECGNIEIWYISQLTKALLKQTHYTGATGYYDYEYSDQNSAFYFTDNTQVAQLQFKYCSATDTVLVLESYKAIPGIVACTWVDSVQKLVCLSCNNIFYQLEFKDSLKNNKIETASISNGGVEYEKYHNLYKLTSTGITKLIQNASIIKELKEIPKRLHEDIENEYIKQQLISVAEKQQISKILFNAHLEYSSCYPAFAYSNDEFIILTTTTKCLEFSSFNQSSNGFALIFVEVKKNEVFLNTQWHLHITSDMQQSHVFELPQNLLNKKICVILPFERCKNQLLPEYRISCYTFITHGMESVVLSIPIHLRLNSASLEKIFIRTIKYSNVKTNFDVLNELFRSFELKIQNDNIASNKNMIEEYNLTIELPACIDPKEILQKINNQSQQIVCRELTLYLSGSSIALNLSDDAKHLKISSNDFGALHHIKIFLYLLINDMNNKTAVQVDEQRKENLLECLSNLEYCCNAFISKSNQSKGERLKLLSKNLENFREIHKKIRTEIALPIL